MTCSIAVIIPAYNAQAYICEALDSVAAQSRKPEQVIVVNDGSTDCTAELVCQWARKADLPIQLVQQANRGPSAARNTAIRYAKTDLIAPLDADDLFLPHHLELLERMFIRHADMVLAFGDAQDFNSTGIVRKSVLAGTRIDELDYDEESDGLRLIRGSAYASLVPVCYILTSATLFPKEVAKHIGLFDERFINGNDRDFFLRLSRAGRFGYYPMLVAKKRTHTDNLTHPRYLVRAQRSRLAVLQKMIDCADDLNLTRWERRYTRYSLARHAWGMLYLASRKGLKLYFETCAYLMRRRLWFRVCNPKHFLRAFTFSTVKRDQVENL